MAPTTPSSKNKYSRQTLHITVGRSRDSFHVHYAQLESTAFFEVHRPTNNDTNDEEGESQASSSRHDMERTLSPDNIKVEEGESAPAAETAVTTPQTSPSKPAYHLEGYVYEPRAFEVIVNYLYNIAPVPPKLRAECKTLLRAYVLALQYRIVGLQDALINCLREYHKEFNVNFEDLIWLVNRLTESPEKHTVPMMQYLIDQIAFEISTQGFTEFSRINVMFEPFLADGTRPIRVVLFKALADVAQADPRRDPADGPNRWRVQDWSIDRTPAQSPMDIIPIDED
ncbi:hypothetical protein PV08_07320 [Exophiala spinifera]|uniref:BTB domain-containing protein n=1 Tax=Exophiala spinifera TaxID=91928 RepID=A0A0D1YI09_9EURO|nr:uncharacterized protein PV08_07320 [Exophiala spinifera]KIW14536.1 hypothetical protein PV08_07320 [Exophiala spinifera]